jgi:hypothetical protein
LAIICGCVVQPHNELAIRVVARKTVKSRYELTACLVFDDSWIFFPCRQSG